MRCGYFDDSSHEYVITDPRTPVKWINYIGTLAFGGYVDHTGGSLLCKGDPTDNRITKYLPQYPAGDFRATTLYLRVHRNDRREIVTPFFVPSFAPLDTFECRVGAGYNRWCCESAGVRAEITVFVPPDSQPVELRRIVLTNTGDRPCDIDVVPVAEFTHPMALMQFTNADWVPQTMQARLVETNGVRFLIQYPFMFRDLKVNFVGCSEAFSSFETDRKAFLGDNEYASWAAPRSLGAGQLSCTEASRGDTIAALMVPLEGIGAGQTREIVVALGQSVSRDEAARCICRVCNSDYAARAFGDLRDDWNNYLAAASVRTPEPDFDRMTGVYNPRQCRVTAQWSRYLSTYQLGLGSRGIGIRDRAQDLMGIVAHDAARVRVMLAELLTMQRADGSAVHQFNPLSKEVSQGDAANHPDRPQYYGDDHLWLVLATCAYLRESADRAFLEERLPFAGSDETPTSVREHLERALAFTAGDCGAHGLPRLGFADWNDTVNLPAGAESVFNACLYGVALRDMAALYEWIECPHEAGRCMRDWEGMRDVVNGCCWDGEWYVRYFDHRARPLGSRANAHGSIYLNAQTWPVIAGFAQGERARTAMDSAHRLLNTPSGLKLSMPGYDGFDPEIGGMTTYPPGAKENGGVFVHANPWAIIASAILGEGDRAFQYYRQVNPAARNDQIEVWECEPYVFAQNVLGDEHPRCGLARNSWLSGAASWMYQAATQHILGVRVEYDTLTVDPCVPCSWKQVHFGRLVRGVRYDITIRNPHGRCRGAVRLLLDGCELEGNRVPLGAGGLAHTVEATLE